ncbi:MAG: glycosyltransferase family 87 protein [Actinomycetota bacterium]
MSASHDEALSREPDIVLPTREDPVVRASTPIIGGPVGRFARIGSGGFWTPVRALILLATLAYMAGALIDWPCMSNGWISPDNYEHLCYSDIPPLYGGRGFAEGSFPYLQTPSNGEILEYPVLTGVFMQIAAWITKAIIVIAPEAAPSLTFFVINAILLFPFFLMAVVCGARIVKARPWDAAMIALAPTIILAGLINWDFIPIGLVMWSLLLWSRRMEFWAGVLLGLAIAAKFYPLIMLGPFLLLCLRAGRMREFGKLLVGTALAWLVVNLPFIIGNFDGWVHFYEFSRERGQDWGSIWYAITLWGLPQIPPDMLNYVATGSFLLLCAGIGALILFAPRRPRLIPMLFLVVAAFAVTNKVYSPQYVMWLVPLAALARPKWRDFLIWQAAEITYFIAIWWYLAGYGIEDAKAMTPQWYAFFTFVHVLATAWFAGLLVRDALVPEDDIVRTDGVPADEDDPAGGCLNDAPDVLPWLKTREPVDAGRP